MAQARTKKTKKTLSTQQSVNAAIKSICDIMRRSNCAGALQYVPELTWILFLRILDERETREAEEADAVGADFTPSLEPPYRWQDWAAPGGFCSMGHSEESVSKLQALLSIVIIPNCWESTSIPAGREGSRSAVHAWE